MQIMKEFKEFAMRGNVVDLAVGVIIGAAFTAIVESLVKDMFTPVLGLLIGGLDFSNIFFVMKSKAGATFNTLKEAQEAGAVTLNVGLFLNAVIKFVIVAFAVFMMVRGLNKFLKPAPGAAPPAPPKSEVLLEEIRDLLKK